MANHWSYHNPVNVHFGEGVRSKLTELLQGQRCLVVASRRGRSQLESDALLNKLVNSTDNATKVDWVDSITPNPDVTELESVLATLKGSTYDAVIGFGGGSSLDAAKAIAVGMAPEFKDKLLSEIIAQPSVLNNASPLALYTVPTTSGTGSEVTPFATIWNEKEKKKYSLAGPKVFPVAALVDPELSLGLPVDSTINTGLDAINQAAESIWNKNATPVTMAYASRALKLGFDALPKLAQKDWSIENRASMAECSLLAGMAISQTRTALCHSISYPLTAHFGIPHGLACGFTMPAVLRLNLQAEDGRFEALKRYLDVDCLENTFDQLHRSLGVVEKVRRYVSDLDQVLALAGEMYTPGRADNNLKDIDSNAIGGILKSAWG